MTENPRVGSSNLSLGTTFSPLFRLFYPVMVTHHREPLWPQVTLHLSKWFPRDEIGEPHVFGGGELTFSLTEHPRNRGRSENRMPLRSASA